MELHQKTSSACTGTSVYQTATFEKWLHQKCRQQQENHGVDTTQSKAYSQSHQLQPADLILNSRQLLVQGFS